MHSCGVAAFRSPRCPTFVLRSADSVLRARHQASDGNLIVRQECDRRVVCC